MPGLNKNTRLRWIDDLHIHLASFNKLKFSAGNRTASVEPSGLALLGIFQEPATIVEAAEVLNRRGAGRRAWIDATAAIMTLRRAGLLVDADGGGGSWSGSGVWNGGPIHIAMLNDRQRVTSLLAAIRQVVRPGDVVVDIGTGTGVLAIAAAQVGAARVYAVEATDIGKLVEANFRANGFEDRITLVTGWSMNVELPERADVLVSEIIGDHPFNERVIEITDDARTRLLKPNARMVPHRVNVFALPVAVPDSIIRRYLFTPERLETWRSGYGLDFGALAGSTPSSFSFSVRPWKLRGCALADPVLVAAADLRTDEEQRHHRGPPLRGHCLRTAQRRDDLFRSGSGPGRPALHASGPGGRDLSLGTSRMGAPRPAHAEVGGPLSSDLPPRDCGPAQRRPCCACRTR